MRRAVNFCKFKRLNLHYIALQIHGFQSNIQEHHTESDQGRGPGKHRKEEKSDN